MKKGYTGKHTGNSTILFNIWKKAELAKHVKDLRGAKL